MQINSQEVTQTPGNNTVFQTWLLSGDENACKKGFERLCALVVNLNKTAKVRFGAEANVNCVIAVGRDAWLKLGLPQPLPKELVNFKAIKGDKHEAVSTAGDIHVHIRALDAADCFDMAQNIKAELFKFAKLADETQGFKYHDGRAIIGFVDGTENPNGEDRDYFAKVGDEDAKFKGGSYVFVQKYKHKMREWNAASVSEQEKVIGRTKADDIEMSEDEKPSNSHSAASNVGDDKKVVRGNMPFVEGSMTGTYFIAYASTFSTVEAMLNKMFIGEPRGNSDRLLDFSTPVTGALFFAPTFDMLSDYSAE